MNNGALSNWGRWGQDDEIGVLNLLTPDVILKAAHLIRKGKVYSLAVPLETNGPQYPNFQKTWKVVHFSGYPGVPEVNFTDDLLIMEAHSGTHIDALGHVWSEGRFYNDVPAETATSEGVFKGGIEKVRHIVGRGVMLDIPALRNVEHLNAGEVVTVEDLDGAAASQGIEIQPGDVVMVRTGWYPLFYKDYELWSTAFPGPDKNVAGWLKEKDVAALGADHPSVEVRRNVATPEGAPLHRYALRDLGVHLMESLDLEELARDKVYECFFVGAPLRLMHASGSPWNPLAIV